MEPARNQETAVTSQLSNDQGTWHASQRCERENKKGSIEVIFYLEVIISVICKNKLEIMALLRLVDCSATL